MAFNLLQTVGIFVIPAPEPALDFIPEPPATLDELIGMNIAFRHSNRFLYPNNYIGQVKDYRYSISKEYPEGQLELLVKSASFNISKWITEGQFVCYEFELPQAVQTVLKTAVA
jgi:hypothetical protein